VTVTAASPRRAQSLRGHTFDTKAEDFPRHHPSFLLNGLGFAVMSGVDARRRRRAGQLCLPDKEFRYLRHTVTSGR